MLFCKEFTLPEGTQSIKLSSISKENVIYQAPTLMRKREVEIHKGQFLSSPKWRTQTSKRMKTPECGGGDEEGGKHRESAGDTLGQVGGCVQRAGSCHFKSMPGVC